MTPSSRRTAQASICCSDRRTYDNWSGFWPQAPSSPMADALNAATKYVATHRPESLEWGPFEGLGADVVDGVCRIKAQGGPDLVLWGSSTLTSMLLDHDLADEARADRLSGIAGHGETLFRGGSSAAVARTCQHEGDAVRRGAVGLQAGRAVAGRIGRRYDVVSGAERLPMARREDTATLAQASCASAAGESSRPLPSRRRGALDEKYGDEQALADDPAPPCRSAVSTDCCAVMTSR